MHRTLGALVMVPTVPRRQRITYYAGLAACHQGWIIARHPGRLDMSLSFCTSDTLRNIPPPFRPLQEQASRHTSRVIEPQDPNVADDLPEVTKQLSRRHTGGFGGKLVCICIAEPTLGVTLHTAQRL